VADRLLRVEDVAREYLAISRTRVYEMIATGQLESIAIGRSRRVPESAVQAYIDRIKEEQATGDEHR
jgi:excisionase family DNA binding protein